ncbi:MAG: GDP-mannose 4,6-dehydratase [Rhodospirillales bacterium]|nr:GDP-mannose 4,6-dehydratase [Rhodospirillales bacterium]MDE2318737.1 GDP-mannose 4,6-dehydratase [Rhodospirillales bacterium]
MTRLLLTGGNGFVGQHLQRHLLQAMPEVKILAPELDITDFYATNRLIETTKPDALLHLAAISTPAKAASAPDHAWAVNVQGTLNLARSVLAHAASCRFIFISSAEVYGRAFLAGMPVTEETPPEPLTPYAGTKAEAEAALAALPGLRLLRLRPTNHTGPGQTPAFVVPAFARQIARIEEGLQPPILTTGNLNARRDFLDVQDVCAAYARALTLPSFVPGEILNIGAGATQRIGDVLETLLGLSKARIRVEADPAKQRASEIPAAEIDTTRAKARLGWAPRIPIQETLSATLDFWRAAEAVAQE